MKVDLFQIGSAESPGVHYCCWSMRLPVASFTFVCTASTLMVRGFTAMREVHVGVVQKSSKLVATLHLSRQFAILGSRECGGHLSLHLNRSYCRFP